MLVSMTRTVKSPSPKRAKPRRGRRNPKSGLIAAMQASPHRDTDVEPARTPMPVREVSGLPCEGRIA
jgi:hypothetical protein